MDIRKRILYPFMGVCIPNNIGNFEILCICSQLTMLANELLLVTFLFCLSTGLLLLQGLFIELRKRNFA